ncbi:caspase family protein [Klebsiella aerogenes]
MPKGISLHIGLNRVDPIHYQGWSGPLTACEADAKSIQSIALFKGFSSTLLLTESATRRAVIDELQEASKKLKAGDFLLLSYSGHGGQLPDLNGDEPDKQDETWCLYDGQLVDDEIYNLLALFTVGVRIFVLADSCHSGTSIKDQYYSELDVSPDNMAVNVKRAMPSQICLRVYEANKEMYDPILADENLKVSKNQVKASALLISGCQDNQLSADGAFNGLFTSKLLTVWNEGGFVGSYQQFHKKIVDMMPPDQTPNYFKAGTIDTIFEKQTPFSI